MTNFDMDVFSAKVKMVDLVIDLNLPMSSLDKLSKGIKKCFMTQKLGNHFNVLEAKGLPLLKKCQPFY